MLFTDRSYQQISVDSSTNPYTAFGSTPTYTVVPIATGSEDIPVLSLSPESLYYCFRGPFGTYSAGTMQMGRTKFIIDSYDWWYTWANGDNHPCTVECFSCKCKKDIPFVYDYQRATDPEAKNNLTYGFDSQLADAFGGQYKIQSGAVVDTTSPPIKLTDSSWFNLNWKIVKHTSHTLQPGQSKRFHKFSRRAKVFDLSKYADELDIEAGGSTVAYGLRVAMRKGSLMYVWRLRPAPEYGTPGAADNGPVEPALTTMSCMMDMRYRVSVLKDNQYLLNAAPVNFPVVSPMVINPLTAAAVTPSPI